MHVAVLPARRTTTAVFDGAPETTAEAGDPAATTKLSGYTAKLETGSGKLWIDTAAVDVPARFVAVRASV